MAFHDELVRALIARRIGQGRLPQDFAATLPQRQALPQPFQGGGTPGQAPSGLRPPGLFGLSRQSLGNFASPFRPLFNPPARPAPAPVTPPVAALQRALRRVTGGDRGGDGGQRGGRGGNTGSVGGSGGGAGTVGGGPQAL